MSLHAIAGGVASSLSLLSNRTGNGSADGGPTAAEPEQKRLRAKSAGWPQMPSGAAPQQTGLPPEGQRVLLSPLASENVTEFKTFQDGKLL